MIYTKFNINDIFIDENSSIRFEYDEDKLNELAESIRQNNNELLQPILISKVDLNQSISKIDPSLPCTYSYKVIAGRRRFLACKDLLKLNKISAIVKEFDSFESEFRAQFAENEERENWTDNDYVKAISFLKERNPKITQIEIANVFGKNLNWVKKKQQHLATIKELPESSTTNLSTSIISELRKLSPTDRLNIITQLNDLAKQGVPLPSVNSIRSKVKKISETGKLLKKIMPLDKEPKVNKKTIIYSDSFNDKNKYNEWKSSGNISNEDAKIIISNLRNKIKLLKSKITTSKKDLEGMELELKTYIKDSITLQESTLFPNKEDKAN